MDIGGNLRGTAFHETGHAVVAWSLGLPVGGIRIHDTMMREVVQRSAALIICPLSTKLRFASLVLQRKRSSKVRLIHWPALVIVRRFWICSRGFWKSKRQRSEMRGTSALGSYW
jgi:hypothetical protein